MKDVSSTLACVAGAWKWWAQEKTDNFQAPATQATSSWELTHIPVIRVSLPGNNYKDLFRSTHFGKKPYETMTVINIVGHLVKT